MASFSFHASTVPLLTSGITTLTNILDKASAHAGESFDTTLASARLAPDMLPLSFQVHVATDTAAKVVARVHGSEPVNWSNDLHTLEAMRARIAACREILEGADAKAFADRADESVTMGLGAGKTVTMPAWNYVLAYGIPNFFFHLQTAYAICRKEGVPLGKSDYLGAFMGPYTKQP